MTNTPTSKFVAAACVHLLTASGGALGLLALLASAGGRWTAAFAWLGAALIVDGIDGPLARYFEVKNVLPRFSGEDLDKTVDYLTYVAVPAFVVAQAPLVSEPLRLPLALAIMIVSLFHFADKNSKTADGHFVGFPAIWNAVVFYCFVLNLPQAANAGLIAACCVLTFVPLRWMHPIRVRRLRPVTLAVVAIWVAAAIWAVNQGLAVTWGVKFIFAVTAVYMVAAALSSGLTRTAKNSA